MPAYRPPRRTVDLRRPSRPQRLHSWLVTGAPTRFGAVLFELAAAVARGARRRIGGE